jgi:heptosyltransferase I
VSALQMATHSNNSVPRENARRLLIVRLGSMGDIIHTLPAVTALRDASPQATIGWIIEERWAELLCTLPTPRSGPLSPQRPLVDYVHAVDTKKWRKAPLSIQTWQELGACFSEVRSRHYDVAIDFQGAARSALIARWSGAQVVFGAAQPRENIASMWYARPRAAFGTHVVEQNLSLAEAVAGHRLGCPAVEFPRDEATEQECCERLRGLGLDRFALLNPGAGWGAKQWPADRYAEVARELAADGLNSLVNFGPGEEQLARSVEKDSGGAAKVIACSLTQLIALTRRATLFIGGDTGPMHLAAALYVPVVALFGPTDPARNGPFGTRSVVLRSPSSSTSHARRPSRH